MKTPNTATQIEWKFSLSAPNYQSRHHSSCSGAGFRCTTDIHISSAHPVLLRELKWHNDAGPDTAAVTITGHATPDMLRTLAQSLPAIATVIEQHHRAVEYPYES